MTVSNLKPKIVFFTGAGLSADSGIRTYRGENGLYNGFRAEKIMSAKTMLTRPEIIHEFCDNRRVELGKAEPNAAHYMIKALADRYGEQIIHLTQNIDDLCEKAGYSDSIHLHGELRVLRSKYMEVDIGYRRYWSGGESAMPEAGFQFRCPHSGKLFRPAVVLFGEPAPNYRTLYQVMGSLRKHDLLVVIGTQGNVLNAQGFAEDAPCTTILNNLHDSDDIDHTVFTTYLKERASVVAPEIQTIVTKHMDRHGL